MINVLREFNLNLGFHLSEILNKALVRPHWIYISLSHDCNFNCQMCGVKKLTNDYGLDFPSLKKVLEEIASWHSDNIVMLTGGEPFLRKDIFEVINYSTSLGIKTEVVTNGSLINNPEIAKRIIKSGLGNIAISLDGTTAQTHDYIRGVNGAYAKALGAISYLSQEKKLANYGPQISVWTTIMKENIEELYDMISLVKNLGVECLVYHPVIAVQEDMQSTVRSSKFWINEDRIGTLKQEIDKINDFQKNNGLVAFLHDPYLWIDYFQGSLTKKHWKCNPFVFIDIGPDGAVRSCGEAFGNVKEISLTECLGTPEAVKARQIMQRCKNPCLQTCWARPEADSLIGIVQNFLSQIGNLDEENGRKKEIVKKGFDLLGRYEDLIIQNFRNER